MFPECENQVEVTFSVRVIPRSSKSEIAGEHDGALKVKLASPPVDGAANAELIKLLAKRFAVPKSSVIIVSGQSARTKRIRVTGVTASELRKKLDGYKVSFAARIAFAIGERPD